MHNKTFGTIALIVAVILLIIAGYILLENNNEQDQPNAPLPQGPVTVQGAVADVAASARIITVEQDGTFYPVAVTSDTRYYDEGGRDAEFSYIHRGFDIAVEGTASENNSIRASVIRVTRAPAIIIYSPHDEEIVSTPTITVSGIARVFENSLMVRVRTSTTSVLFEEPVMTQGNEMGQFGQFNYSFTLSKNILPGEKIFIDAFEYSARDGSQINTATVAIYVTHEQTTTVQVFFLNDRLDPQISCIAAFPVQRVIPYTQGVGTAAIQELLKGPIGQEPSSGYYTSIPADAKLNSLRIENGTAYADFNAGLDRNIGGSCMVSAIRAQITKTLQQFPSVQNVVISVNGNIEEALQP